MTDEEVEAAAMADPDVRPPTAEQCRIARRVPRTKTPRRALGFTKEEFALRYHIPPAPDQPSRAHLTVIAHDPEALSGLQPGSAGEGRLDPRALG
jgi:putative transcriptional regulator